MDQEQNKTSQEEREYANQLRQKLNIARTGVGLTKYRGSKGHHALGIGVTGVGALAEGRGVEGAAGDIAISEVKRRVIKRAIVGLGLEAEAMQVDTIEQGLRLGFYLRKEIKDGKFNSFIPVLLLSILKDLIDIVGLGTAGVFLWWFVTPALWVIFFLQRSVLKRYIIKKFLWPYILSMVVETIPEADIFPSYTVMAILLKLKIDKRIKKFKVALEVVEKATKKKQIFRKNYE